MQAVWVEPALPLFFLRPTSALQDTDEWHSWRTIGDEVLHIELRRWAQAMTWARLAERHRVC